MERESNAYIYAVETFRISKFSILQSEGLTREEEREISNKSVAVPRQDCMYV